MEDFAKLAQVKEWLTEQTDTGLQTIIGLGHEILAQREASRPKRQRIRTATDFLRRRKEGDHE